MDMKALYSNYQPINCENNIPSFLVGLSKIFDFFGILRNPGRKTEVHVDMLAMRSDFESVGFDFYTILSTPDLDEKIKK